MPGRALAWLWLHEWEWVRSGGNTLAWFPLAFSGPCSSAIAFSPYIQSWLPSLLIHGLHPKSSLAEAAGAPAGVAGVKKACNFCGDFLPKPHTSSMQIKSSRWRAASWLNDVSVLPLSGQCWPNLAEETTWDNWLLLTSLPSSWKPRADSSDAACILAVGTHLWGSVLEAATAGLLDLWISTPSSLIFVNDHQRSSHSLTHNPEYGHGAGGQYTMHLSNWLGFPFKIHMWTQERQRATLWEKKKKSSPASSQSVLFDYCCSSALCWTRRMNYFFASTGDII